MKKNRSTKFAQTIYLTFANYTRNSLYESAASCSFGFLFSIIPVILLIFSLLSGLMGKYPALKDYVLIFANQIQDIYDITPIISSNTKFQVLSVVDIILGLWLIWMARRFFLSVAQAMHRVFRSVAKPLPLFAQVMAFLGELILISAVILIILSSFLIKELFEMEASFISFPAFFSKLISKSTSLFSSSILYIVIFLFGTVVFRFESRVKPKLGLCCFCSALCTGAFFAVSIFFNQFMDYSRYNLVYGTLSTIIILMLKVYAFFILFLFFAQYIYVSTCLSTLLFGELYFLPKNEKPGLVSSMRRLLFINPSALQTPENTVHLNPGENLFLEGDKSKFVYYIVNGTIIKTDFTDAGEKDSVIVRKGSFIGEKNCLLHKPRTYTATAKSNCELIKISAEEYLDFLQDNPSAINQFVLRITK